MLWLIFFVVLAAFLYEISVKPFKYWLKRGVSHKKPWPLVGNMGDVVLKRVSISHKIQKLYTEYPDKRYNGFFQFMSPILLIRDLDLIRQLAVKDFDHFEDHRPITKEYDSLIGKAIFSLKGKHWREMRATLSPAFTSAKMRALFSFMTECADQFSQHFHDYSKNTIAVEMKDIFTRFANDIIATAAFGVKCDSLSEKKNKFFVMGKKATTFTDFRLLKMIFLNICPRLLNSMGVQLFPMSVERFFDRFIKDTMNDREQNGVVRPDILHLLMEAKKGTLKHESATKPDEDAGFATAEESHIGLAEKNGKLAITDDEIMAQAFIFYFAGFDSTSTLMSFMSYEIALNTDIQKRLQKEIDDTLASCSGVLTYDALMGMKYMDMVVSETLRKWPPAVTTDRVCVKPYTIKPNGAEETAPLHIDSGTGILIPIYGLHHDPNYFPNPDKFDPERFNDENRQKIRPFTYMPFGVGPRNCIGSRFALMETKIVFFYMLLRCDIMLIEKTQVPLQILKGAINIIAEKGIWLGLKSRKY